MRKKEKGGKGNERERQSSRGKRGDRKMRKIKIKIGDVSPINLLDQLGIQSINTEISTEIRRAA